jgi:hypothetical protein
MFLILLILNFLVCICRRLSNLHGVLHRGIPLLEPSRSSVWIACWSLQAIGAVPMVQESCSLQVVRYMTFLTSSYLIYTSVWSSFTIASWYSNSWQCGLFFSQPASPEPQHHRAPSHPTPPQSQSEWNSARQYYILYQHSSWSHPLPHQRIVGRCLHRSIHIGPLALQKYHIYLQIV